MIDAEARVAFFLGRLPEEARRCVLRREGQIVQVADLKSDCWLCFAVKDGEPRQCFTRELSPIDRLWLDARTRQEPPAN